MGLYSSCVNWISFLLVPLLVAHATEYKVILKLDRSGVSGAAQNVTWTPPRGLVSQDTTLVCTKGESTSRDPYCSFSHSSANITWTRILVVSKQNSSKEDVYCFSTFHAGSQTTESGVQMVTFVNNHTACYSPRGVGLYPVRLRTLERDLRSGGHYRLVPRADGPLFHLKNVKGVEFEGVTPGMCSRYLSFHAEEGIDEVRVENDFFYFPLRIISVKCWMNRRSERAS